MIGLNNRPRMFLAALLRSHAIAEFTPEGEVVKANNNFLAMTKYRREEILGKSHDVLVRPDEREQPSYQDFWAALRRGESLERRFQAVDKDGNKIWLHATYSPMVTAYGKVARVLAVVHPAQAA